MAATQSIEEQVFFDKALVFAPDRDQQNYETIIDGTLFILNKMLTVDGESDYELKGDTFKERAFDFFKHINLSFSVDFIDEYCKEHADSKWLAKFKTWLRKDGPDYLIDYAKVKTKGDLAFLIYMIIAAVTTDANGKPLEIYDDDDPIQNIKRFLVVKRPMMAYVPRSEVPAYIRPYLRVFNRMGKIEPYR